MTSHHYEVALFAEFFAKDLKPILNRITLHSESSNPIHTREIVFEPLDAQAHRDQGQEPTILRAKKELRANGEEAPWSVSSALFALFLLSLSKASLLVS